MTCDVVQVADMLRIISLTKDPVCLTRFLQDQVLPGLVSHTINDKRGLIIKVLGHSHVLTATVDVSCHHEFVVLWQEMFEAGVSGPWFSSRFLTVVPRVLADVYHSLGTQLPEALLALLPADFFSDESVAKDSVSPSVSSPSLSSASLPSERGERLRELRRCSASQRR